MTQNKDATRYYSNIQENLVANFLNGSVVAGSGSNKFAPGDVKTDKYLIECKTHTKQVPTIQFNSEHWVQIIDEAVRSGRFPVLCVDNGTQKVENTFVLTHDHCIDLNKVDLYKLPVEPNGKNISFSCDGIVSLFNSLDEVSEELIPGFAIDWVHSKRVVIMRLQDFKDVMFT